MSSNRIGNSWRVLDQSARLLVASLLLLVLASFVLAGCSRKPQPRKSCAVFYASDNLNFYEGEPHPITVHVYPLSAPTGFQQAMPEELLGGEMPDGVLAPPVSVVISPGDERKFVETFPDRTQYLGLLADYFRAPGEPRGTLTQVVRARCGMRKPKLVLSPKDIYLK